MLQTTSASAYGLPFRCLKYDSTFVTVQKNGGFSIDSINSHAIEWNNSAKSFRATFPILPLFPGLLLNTLFYATLFSTPYLLRQTRRHLRLRRGHCPRCDYNLLNDFTNPCPECGHNSAVFTAETQRTQS